MNQVRLYSFTIMFLALSASIASAQEALTPVPFSADVEDSILFSPPPVTHQHTCPSANNSISCLSDPSFDCRANYAGEIWKSGQISFMPKKPYVLDGIVGVPAPGGGDILLTVTGCQYQDKNKKQFILNIPPEYLHCTGTKGESTMSCKR